MDSLEDHRGFPALHPQFWRASTASAAVVTYNKFSLTADPMLVSCLRVMPSSVKLSNAVCVTHSSTLTT